MLSENNVERTWNEARNLYTARRRERTYWRLHASARAYKIDLQALEIRKDEKTLEWRRWSGWQRDGW